jgi:chromosome segregation ATPase
MKKTNLNLFVLLVVASLGLSACNAPESNNSSSQGETAQASLNAIQLESLEPQLDELESKLFDANAEINALTLLNLTNVAGGTGAEAKAQGLADKISEVLNKFVGIIEQVAAKKKELRDKINAAVAKLDPAMPNYAELKKRADEMLSYLDQLDAQIKQLQTQLIAKIDQKIAAIDLAVSKMSPNSPVTWIVSLVWQTVKVKVVDARNRLATIQI